MEMESSDASISTLIACVASNDDLESAIDFAVDFAARYSIIPKTLFELTSICEKEEMFREKYVFARACAASSDGKLREDAYLLAGDTALFLKQKDRALQDYLTALSLNPENPEALSRQGFTLTELERPEEALRVLEKALVRHPFHPDTLCNYGYLLSRPGHFAEAERAFRKALVLDPMHVNTHCRYGTLLSELNQNTGALYHYKRALELDPMHAESNYRYALFLTRAKNPIDAEV
ncbi:MAG: tetratricopeptide repeat protein, partial [Methanosarcinaceae archaeon]|nr:tetratricopeptide repeat protein [Methanosarcinaceae archaeon]